MKSFKTESKKILDMMINSIYTNKEIFLRELISNASDANDKLYYQSLTNTSLNVKKEDLNIKIIPNKEKRTLTISDTGIGMNKESLEKNLGTIAKSGSEEFKSELKDNNDVSIIGQFGVGFYSSFMVANKVEVISKTNDSEEAYKWTSCGSEGYEIDSCSKETTGTDIVLYLKDNDDTFNYDEYLEEYKIKDLIKKYSDFIKYPIELLVSKESEVDGVKSTSEEFETINTMMPLWLKNKKDITEEEYNNFYTNMFHDYDNPLTYLHFSIEGKVSFKALLYVPSKTPYDFYTKDYEKGLKLYTNGVLITDKCSSLLPDYLSYIKGVVDADLPLNVSRETIQDSKELKLIAEAIETKLLDCLKSLLKDDKEKYEKYYTSFGTQLKYCIYKSYGILKEKLIDLVMYHSLKNDKLITLEEYYSNRSEGQKKIYYACGKTINSIKRLPQVNSCLANDNDVLCFLEDFDEFAIKFVNKYKDIDIVNVSSEKFEDEETVDEEDKTLIEEIKTSLSNKVSDVKFTSKLTNFPVALSSNGDLSLEMEKVLKEQYALNGEEAPKAERVLKIKKDSEIYDKLKGYYLTDKDKLKDTLNILYAEAELLSGIDINNVEEFISLINKNI